MFTSALYRVSPPWLQEQFISTRALVRNLFREGTRFHRTLREIEASQWLDREQLQALQWQKTHEMLRHAAAYVPYYENLFAKHAIDVNAFQSLADVAQIPLLDKATVRANPGALLAQNIRGPRIPVHTSGSTGAPLQMLQNMDAVIRENAFIWRQLSWAGYRRGERRAWVRGDMVVPFERREPPFWRMNTADNMLMLSSYHLSEESALAYVEALERFDPVLIQAYPSSIGFIARFLQAKGRPYRGRSLRAIVTTSETLTEKDNEAIERQLGCRIFEQYGSGERVTMIQTCEKGGRHIDADYGYTELLPLGDGAYEIVGTGFNNFLMPLIRYRSGDTVEVDPAGAGCACGRSLPLIKKVHGRLDDYIKTPDGRRIGRLDHIFKGLERVAEGQIVQDAVDEIVVRVVPFGDFNKHDQAKLIANAQSRLGNGVQIRVECVNEIPRTRNGKFRAVVCNV